MDLSARSYLTAGISLTAATAIAFAPLAVPPSHPADIRLTATPAEVVGAPGQALIGVVDNIVTLIDVVFTGLIDATEDPTLAASLSILETLSSGAFAKLAENLGLANEVITSTTDEVVTLLTSALTGSPAGGVASGPVFVENVWRALAAVGEAAVRLVEIAVSEVTFQVRNLAAGVGALVHQLGQAASGPPEAVSARIVVDEADDVYEDAVAEEPVDEAGIDEAVVEDTAVDEDPLEDVATEEDSSLEEALAEDAAAEVEEQPELTAEEPTENAAEEPTEKTPGNTTEAEAEVSPAESR
jgi:hypothetical protein